jgi:hypothetical protein
MIDLNDFKTKYMDPDFRPVPKTKRFCCVCSRDIKSSSPARTVFVVNGGMEALHPSEWAKYPGHKDDTGKKPIGADCARKLGLEWSVRE